MFAIRSATLADVPVLTETVWQGFDGYRTFAPPGWSPPGPDVERARIRERLVLADAWCLVAQAGDEPAGHVAVMDARELAGDRAVIPGLGHLWMLFVRRPWWGSGLAGRLLHLALAEATGRGYTTLRLFTPAGQARARAFYEREGFMTDGTATLEPMIGLELVEYRRPL